MDDLTNEVLILLGSGKITKEAAIAALRLNPHGVIKIADDDGKPAGKGMSVQDTIKMLGLTMLMTKGFEMGGSAIDKLFSGNSRKRNDALFQKLMREHPGLQGKDVARAKANFDYIAQTSPHLLKHPLILGDNVANMTAMGATALDTLKTISDVEKGVTPKKPSEFAGTAAKDIAKAIYTPVEKPLSFEQQVEKAQHEEEARTLAKSLAKQDLMHVPTGDEPERPHSGHAWGLAPEEIQFGGGKKKGGRP